MKAARFYDRGDIRIEDIPEPEVTPGTVGIKVAWCGICGTDLPNLWKDQFLFHRVDIRILFQANLRRLLWDMRFFRCGLCRR